MLGGSGLSWQDGHTYRVAPGDCLLHAPRGPAHALIAGDDGLQVLGFGQRARTETGPLPRAGVTWIGGSWAELGTGEHPWDREAAAGPLEVPAPEQERPGTVVNLEPVDPYYPRSRTLAIPGLRASFTVEQVDVWDREA